MKSHDEPVSTVPMKGIITYKLDDTASKKIGFCLSKYREYQRCPDAENDELDFAGFRELMWHNARNLPELVPFFERAENEAMGYAADTRYYHVKCGPQCEFTLTVLLNYASIQHRVVADDDDAPHLRNGVTLRHILHELFERPECVLLG